MGLCKMWGRPRSSGSSHPPLGGSPFRVSRGRHSCNRRSTRVDLNTCVSHRRGSHSDTWTLKYTLIRWSAGHACDKCVRHQLYYLSVYTQISCVYSKLRNTAKSVLIKFYPIPAVKLNTYSAKKVDSGRTKNTWKEKRWYIVTCVTGYTDYTQIE